MEFLGVGYQELILILVLMLVVVGPERLPTVAYQIGRAVRTLQRYARVVRDEFRDEIDYLDEQYRVVKGEVDTARHTLRTEQARFQAELRDVAPASLELLPAAGGSSDGGHPAEDGTAGESPPPAAEETPSPSVASQPGSLLF